MNRWQVGNVSITRVVELEVTGGSRFILPDATRDAVLPMEWLAPHFMDREGNLIMSVHALVVETPTRKIMVDTCIGNDKERPIPAWSHLQTSFLADLESAGFRREEIDTVLCTHLHVDHVGWNTMLVDGRWVPTFPNARYLMGREEYEYWNTGEGAAGFDAIREDSVGPVFDAGLVELVDVTHRVCDEIVLEPTPGHTPGHVSVHIESEGEQAVITGDCFHHPCQVERVDWCSSADADRGQAVATRRAFLERYGDREVMIVGTHFATPTAGHLKSGQTGYWFEAVAV